MRERDNSLFSASKIWLFPSTWIADLIFLSADRFHLGQMNAAAERLIALPEICLIIVIIAQIQPVIHQ